METPTLLPCIDGIHVDSIAAPGNAIVLYLSTTRPTACCPMCGKTSERIHSQYRRTLTDLPWNRVTVRIHLRARKFVCASPDCTRKVFTEPVRELAERYARKTKRLQAALYLIGYALGGEAGARVAIGLGITVSPDTLLSHIRQVGKLVAPQPPVRVLGVDDWAFKKGHHYGTILVDLERHRVLDLLPDRTAESLTAWIKAHPGIEVVSRDRGGNYSQGARAGAPKAVQVADRFHLLKNVGDLLERVLTRHYRQLRETTRHLATVEPVPEPAVPVSLEPVPPRPLTRVEQDSAYRRERRFALYERVLELHQHGLKQRAIARKMGLSRNTIRKWIDAGGFPEHARRSVRSSKLAPFMAYLKQRWEQECPSAVQLFAEIQAKGYAGSIDLVQRSIQPWRASARGRPRSHREEPPSARTVLWWLLGYFSKTDADLQKKQMQFVAHLCQLCPDVKTARDLALRFVSMVKQRCAVDLDAWREEAKNTQIAELKNFAKSLCRDYAAVREALSSPFSNGQVEGQVNRLKFVKRSMYGRAKFDLLKARVLPLAQAA